MYVVIKTDKDNYVTDYYYTNDADGAYDVSMSDVDVGYIGCYQFVDNKFILDNEKYEEEKADDEKQNEIILLKNNLADTDYIFCKELEEITSLSNPLTFVSDIIKILVNYATVYKDVIAQRKAWRARIEELGG